MKTLKTFPETDCPRANAQVVEPFCLGDFFIMGTIEIWVDAFGYDNIYEVSNLGRVKSIKYGLLSISKYEKGYCYVGLRINNIQKKHKIHRIVWESFKGKIPKGFQVDHINNDKEDNRLCNLQLLTPRQNTTKHYLNSKKSSSFIGVKPKNNKWQARIVINKKSIYLGCFNTEIEASIAYQAKLATI